MFSRPPRPGCRLALLAAWRIRRHPPPLACPCGKRMRYLATIFERRELQRLLTAKGLPHHTEELHPARGPPQQYLDFGP